MREIIFRAWWKDDNTLVDPKSYVIRPDGTIEFPEGGWDLQGWDSSDLVILEQYTGLKDKNGKKIFEGDIVHIDNYDEGWDSVVGFNGGAFAVDVEGCDYDYTAIGWTEYEAVIIGNIHDNPELVEVL